MLTQKQENFCLNYFEYGNASEAARIAGYSTKTAGAIGRENLQKPRIVDRISQLRKKAEDASVMSVVERKQRLTEIARANIPDYVSPDGIKVEKKSPNVGAVSEITTKTKVFRKGGEPIHITNLKLHSPTQAIDLLNKMDRVYGSGEGLSVQNLTVNIDKAVIGASERLENAIAMLSARIREDEVPEQSE